VFNRDVGKGRRQEGKKAEGRREKGKAEGKGRRERAAVRLL
jgi:hypothetical protein